MKKKTDIDIARQILNEGLFNIGTQSVRSFLPTAEKVSGKYVRNPSTTPGEVAGGIYTSGLGRGNETSNLEAAANIASDAALSTGLGTLTGIGGKGPLNITGRLTGNVGGDLMSRATSKLMGNEWQRDNPLLSTAINIGSYMGGDMATQYGTNLGLSKLAQTGAGKALQTTLTTAAQTSGIPGALRALSFLGPASAIASTAVGSFQLGNMLSKGTGLENRGIDPSETAQGRIDTYADEGERKARKRIAAGNEEMRKLVDSGASQEELDTRLAQLQRIEKLSGEARQEELQNRVQGANADTGPGVWDQFKAGFQATKEFFGGDTVTAKSERALSAAENMTRETGEFLKGLKGMTPEEREKAMQNRAQNRAQQQQKIQESKKESYYNILSESLENVSEELGINFRGYQATKKAQRAARVYQKQLETRPEMSYSGDSTVEDQATKPRADGGVNHEAFVKNAVIDLMTKAQSKGVQMTHGEAQNIAIQMLKQKMGD